MINCWKGVRLARSGTAYHHEHRWTQAAECVRPLPLLGHGCYPLPSPLPSSMACSAAMHPDIPRRPRGSRTKVCVWVQCSSLTRCKMALQSMQPNAGILAAHHGCHASDLTYGIVLRRVPWISRSISQPVNGAAAGTTSQWWIMLHLCR